jgi:thiamine-phosphate pyrophosphorylase
LGRSLPRLHVVTDDTVLRREGWESAAIEVLEAGGTEIALHVRGPGTGSRRLLDLAIVLGSHARRTGGALFVNDRVDVALVAEVDGVHLGEGSLTPGGVRALVGAAPWIGVSRHGVDEAAAAGEEGADYVFLGTIFPTDSHPGEEGAGLAAIEEACRRSLGLPILGIGGIGPEAAASLVATGAYGVAAIRGIWDAPDPGSAVRRYLEGVGNRRERQ